MRSSMWLICASGVSKFLGFACQLALAWFLTKHDFGVYAIAISLSVILTILRDGGLPMVLEQKGRGFVEFAGPALWLMLLINGATGIVTFLIAGPAASYYGMPELEDVIRLFAVSVPLSVLPSILVVRLSVDLRFRQLSLIQLLSAFARNALLFTFAASGYGARSFVLPLLIGSLLDTAMLWYATRHAHWDWRPKVRYWRELFAAGRWVMLGTFAIAVDITGAYFILGKCLTSEELGVYFFAFQLIVQRGALLAENAYQVLFPTFIRMGWDLGRIRQGVRKALQVIVVGGAAVSLGIGAVYDPLQTLLWGGKWAAAGPPIHVLALVWPAVATLSVLRASQMAVGHFQQWGTLMLTQAAISIAGAGIGAVIGGSALASTLGYAVGILVGVALNAIIALRGIRMRASEYPWATFLSWLWLVAAAAAAQAIGSVAHHPGAQVLLTAGSYGLLGLAGLKVLGDGALTMALASAHRALGKPAPASRLAARFTGS